MNTEIISFIIRITCEQKDELGRTVVWRGSIERVGDGHRLYFQDLNSIERYIQEQTGIDARQDAWWHSFWARLRNGN